MPVLLLLLSNCRVTNELQEEDKMLVKNIIELEKTETGLKKLTFDQDDLPGILVQKPNKRFLGVLRLGENLYVKYQDAPTPSFKHWLWKLIGKEPVYYDRFAAERSVRQLQLYLNNHGYFKSIIRDTVKVKRQKVQAVYSIKLAKPYTINEIEYLIPDTALRTIVLASESNSLIKTGDVFNANLLDDERYRISRLLRNHGYFYFSPEFVFFEIDSAFSNFTLKIYTNIGNPQGVNDSISGSQSGAIHSKYFLNRIAINTEFSPGRGDTSTMSSFTDTTSFGLKNRYTFYYRDKLRVSPNSLRNLIFFKPGQVYTESKQENTYRQLSGLSLYGYTSISFTPLPETENSTLNEPRELDAMINLTRRPVQSFSVETEGTTSGSTLGLAGNLVYQNLNIFRGAEVFTLKFTTGLEWQQGGPESEDVFLFFNTVQTGVEASLDFPKFLIPFTGGATPNVLRPRTTLMVGVNYQNRPDYLRYITNASFGYNWRVGKFIIHNLTPVELNSVSIFPDSSFVKRLEEVNDPRLTNQYTDHFIMSAKYSFLYNNQERNKIKNFTYFRWGIETAGNFLQLINKATGSDTNEEGEAVLWNIPYSQFVRSDVDLRRYFTLDQNNTIVLRGLAGVGIAYGNSTVLPFEKGFYAGGANDMRGWKYRSLGPGAFRDTSGQYFEKMGDLLLETNLEYRFPLYSFIKGAVFGDLGNIWLLTVSENYPGGLFKWEDFLGQLAFSSGAGFRFDFSYFIFRIDASAPMKNPSYPEGERWRVKNLTLKDVIWNFGIGYPF